MKLLKTQKNQLFEIIAKHSLPAENFYFENKESAFSSETIENLKVKNFDYYVTFDFSNLSNIYVVSFKPASENVNKILKENFNEWKEVLVVFEKWVKIMVLELLEPDKWKEYYNRFEKIDVKFPDNENTSFTYPEIELLKKSVLEIKEGLKKVDLDKFQVNKLEEKLDYLVEKSKTMGRRDWKGLFIGSLLGVMMDLSLTSDVAKSVWIVIGNALKPILILALNQ